MHPHILEAGDRAAMASTVKRAREDVLEHLARHGAVLVRGTPAPDAEEFREAVRALAGDTLDYVYRSTPRTALGGGIYTTTEYPKGMWIPMHSENAYQREWPLMLCFCCVVPAEQGGQTPLADLFQVTERIGAEVRREFQAKGVRYVRNYSAQIDLPWQTVFQTDSRGEVEEYCRSREISVEWTASGGLRTAQTCQGMAAHPASERVVWFNQAHLFHPSALDRNTRAALAEMLPEDEWPRNVTFGDGSRIEEAVLDHVREVFDAEKQTFDWQAGDLLVLDNMRVCHGRAPYRGDRRVLAAMAQPYSPQ